MRMKSNCRQLKMKLVKRIKVNKPKLKSLRHKINQQNKKQLQYFQKQLYFKLYLRNYI